MRTFEVKELFGRKEKGGRNGPFKVKEFDQGTIQKEVNVQSCPRVFVNWVDRNSN